MDERRELLRRRIGDLGFDDVRFASLATPPPGAPLTTWLAAGRHADMDWMGRTAAKRLDPNLVLPGVRSAIMLGVNYAAQDRGGPGASPARDGRQEREGRRKFEGPVWARYALHRDYHDTITPALARAGALIEELCGAGPDDYRYYVDTGPVLERTLAARAGLGFVGKNSMLISRRHGNWLFLAVILTRLDFAADPPIRLRGAGKPAVGLLCGKCVRCMEACPTNAFDGPGILNAGRCISYQTIENKGIIPRELRPAIGAHIYGCDVCLEVCPWNRFARRGRRLILAARGDISEVPLSDLLRLTPARFAELFRGTAIKRIKLAGLLRNACIVAGNSGDPSLIDALLPLASHPLPLIRVHAVWALFRLGARPLLTQALSRETDASVLDEYSAGTAHLKVEKEI